MQTLFRAVIALLAAVLGLGLYAFTTGTANADEVAATREDGITLLHDDSDDDTDGDGDDDTDGVTTFDSNTGDSNDATGSRVTAVSQDRDVSNDDLTKDRTMDGGDPTRDHSASSTNDSTKNDTRRG